MSRVAKVFMNGRSQAIRLPKEFRVEGEEVHLSRVPGGILISESDPWQIFEEGANELGEEFFSAMETRDRSKEQSRDFSAGL